MRTRPCGRQPALAQLPRMPFPQVMATEEPECRTDVVTSVSDGMLARPTSPCRCGCGEPAASTTVGRHDGYISGAHRIRTLRAFRLDIACLGSASWAGRRHFLPRVPTTRLVISSPYGRSSLDAGRTR